MDEEIYGKFSENLAKMPVVTLWHESLAALYLLSVNGREGEKLVRQKIRALRVMTEKAYDSGAEFPKRITSATDYLHEGIPPFVLLTQTQEEGTLSARDLFRSMPSWPVLGRSVSAKRASSGRSIGWREKTALKTGASAGRTIGRWGLSRLVVKRPVGIVLHYEDKPTLSPSQLRKTKKKAMQLRRATRSA